MAWRFIAIAAALAIIGIVIGKLQLLFIAVFLAFVLTAILRPITNFLSRYMPRPLALIIALLLAIAFVGGLVTFIVVSVVGQWNNLSTKFIDGLAEINIWLENSNLPFGVTSGQIKDTIQENLLDLQMYLRKNWSQYLSTLLSSVGVITEGFACFVLAVFMSVFFINSGHRIWGWFLHQVPRSSSDRWARAGDAAWATFSGYTRGIFLVAATNGLFAGIALQVLDVPLAAPLGVLVFIGTFIPLIGSPLAMIIAVIVALAANGPITALVVLGLIVLIGQLEGHVLQPLIMGHQVSIHPVVVALAVTAGTLTFGVIGAVIAVPIVAVAWAVFAELRPPRPDDEFTPTPPPPRFRLGRASRRGQ